MKKIIILALGLLITSLSVFAQKSGKQDTIRHVTLYSYSCPMHPNFISDKPGKCPKCGMNMTLSTKEQMKAEVVKLYTCPMHPEVTSNKPGKCPKCGMDMVEKKQPVKSKVKANSGS